MKTDKNFADHELNDDVIHGLKSPYIRLSDMKFNPNKHPTKKWSNKLSREISSGTHYYLTHKFLDILLPSLKKLSIRHFVNAFHNAMAPHKNFFIEWDGRYVNEDINADHPEYLYADSEVRFGVSSTYARPNVVSYKDSSSRNFRNLSEHFGDRHDTQVHEGQRLSFFANTNTKKKIIRKEYPCRVSRYLCSDWKIILQKNIFVMSVKHYLTIIGYSWIGLALRLSLISCLPVYLM